MDNIVTNLSPPTNTTTTTDNNKEKKESENGLNDAPEGLGDDVDELNGGGSVGSLEDLRDLNIEGGDALQGASNIKLGLISPWPQENDK